MKLEQLNTFLVAADLLNFTAAARRFDISQSAISQQIRELEASLGVSLFERRGRGLVLTLAGERLRQRVPAVLREVRLARLALQDLVGCEHGTLRIGANSTPGIYLLPALLGIFSEQYPAVKVSLHIAPLEAVSRQLREGELDMAVLTEGTQAVHLSDWESHHVGDDELSLIASVKHPLAGQRLTSAEAVRAHPLILRPNGSSTRQRVLAALARLGIEETALQITFELSHTEGIKQAVLSNLGIAWVSRMACERERRAGWLREVNVHGLRLNRPLWALVPPMERRPAHLQAFLDLLSSTLASVSLESDP